MVKRVECPKCRSINVSPLGEHKKGFSVGKAVDGAILTAGIGGIGLLAGFCGKKKGYDMLCNNCGVVFRIK